MKTISFLKQNLLTAALVIAAGVAMSFGPAKEQPVKKTTVYYYISNDMSTGAFRDTSHWDTVDNGVPCQIADPELPCRITVAPGQTLSSVLGNKSNEEVLTISEGFKQVQ